MSEIHSVFDTDLGQKFITTTPESCVKHYTLAWWDGGAWQTVLEERGNYQRQRRHAFDPVTSTRYRLTVLETWGVREARIYEIRLYG